MPQWETPPWIKLHENCGGVVCWVEAINTPSVGYTGDCSMCRQDGIPTEEIIPLYDGSRVETGLRERIEACSREDLAGLRWNDDADFDTNQARLKAEIIELAPVEVA